MKIKSLLLNHWDNNIRNSKIYRNKNSNFNDSQYIHFHFRIDKFLHAKVYNKS